MAERATGRVAGNTSDWHPGLLEPMFAPTRATLALASRTFLRDTAARLNEAGVVNAVPHRESATIIASIRVDATGISDRIALTYDVAHRARGALQ